MVNEVAEKKEQVLTYQANGQEVKLTPSMVRNFIAKGSKSIDDKEIVMFLNLCKYQGLNPFLNEAYLVKFGNDAQIITSKEAFMKRAESNKNYGGFEAGVIVTNGGEVIDRVGAFTVPGDELVGGWAKVYRNDRKVPVEIKVSLEEYDKKKSTWNDIKKTMIRKVAIVQALREAFPQDLGGMYTEDENRSIKDVDTETVVEEQIQESANQENFEPNPLDVPEQPAAESETESKDPF